jgi:hypothetical protein
MAVEDVTVAHVSELARRSRRADGREAGGGEHSPPQFSIQSECALTNMNARSGENLTGRVLPNEVNAGASQDTCGAASRCHGQSAVLPDDGDMHLGRERPPKTRPGTDIGGWQRGSLTPQMPPSPLLTTAPAATRAAKSAARLTVVKSLIVNDIDTSPR